MDDVIKKGLSIVSELRDHGFEAYIVGGAVRDYHIGRKPKDVDVVTSASPEEIRTLYPHAFQINRQFQTLTVHLQKVAIEVSTLRGGSIEDDLCSRDFTINAMALAMNGDIIDPTGGKTDLENGVIRSFHPEARFKEDPLRMLRAPRFASELGFTVAKGTAEAIKGSCSLLADVAVERVEKELTQLMIGTHRSSGWCLLHETGLYPFIPGVSLSKETVLRMKEISRSPGLLPADGFWAILYLLENRSMKLPLAKEKKKRIRTIVHYVGERQNHSWNETMLYQASLSVATVVEQIRALFGQASVHEEELRQLWSSLPIQTRTELAVTGRDVMAHFQKKGGPWLADTLADIEEAVLLKHIENEKKSIIQWLEERRVES
ncbi:CCA tRNA nucleotidyltransferase [Halalkalibacterium halodurans]|jgi:tRNA nucleotidyltransferase (CCA-adding enzyme)|uniref:CCA tRNA nucleotidyltransferase n=1 Tax=Halalkalibacterium halodurans TaxID=86665 RepID=UPI0006A944BD|nr:CCA tRNA nucleotidyltransferase [Halalkalibacterium halodurans]MED4123887.1 CCA tRNA nucleotidyltransferase [Halalkalibacterium halodurans]TPE70821.1 CCA tRNA nucleotidyltransferase [Halalkalibacterium halodurans]